jgi:hypothetical protein
LRRIPAKLFQKISFYQCGMYSRVAIFQEPGTGV